MARNLKISTAAATAEATALGALLNTGYLRIYSGSQPATANTAIGAQVLLAELRFAATAVASVTDGVATFNTLTPDSAGNTTGTAAWFRCFKSDGTTPVFDGSVAATAPADLVIASTAITPDFAITATSFTYTVNAS